MLVVEALDENSGSLITARFAAEQGRNVYVPSPNALHGNYAEGTKKLLMDGAFPIYRADDLLADILPHLRQILDTPARTPEAITPPAQPTPVKQEMPASPPVPATPAPSANADEATLLELLQASPLCPDDILLAAQEKDGNWTAPRMLSTLMMLEVKGLVRRLADSRYETRL